MNLRELKPFGELDKYVDNAGMDEDSQRPISSLWEPHAGMIIQPRREPWGKPTKYLEDLQPVDAPRDGVDGTDGTDGEDGSTGPQGPQGPQGPAGTDATIPAGIIVFSTLNDLGEGWHLCDGTDGTPDLRGRFIVTVGNSPGANPETYEVEDTGGYAWHGQSENNHNDHRVSHVHGFPELTLVSCVLENVGSKSFYAFGSNYVPACDDNISDVESWCGSDTQYPHHQEAPTPVEGPGCVVRDYAKHKGPFNSYQDTDNRPPFIALYAHIKL